MGLFSKISDNIHHGGVDISMVAPGQITSTDASIQAQITLLSKDKPQQIDKVTLKLVLHTRALPTAEDPNPMEQQSVVAENSYATPFTLQPGQPQVLPLALSVDFGQFSFGDSDNHVLQGIEHVAERMQQFNDANNPNGRRYELVAQADVPGIAFDPTTTQRMQILHEQHL